MPLPEDDPGSYLTDDAAETIIRESLNEFDVQMDADFSIGSVTMTIVALDHGEDEQAYRAVGHLDHFTRVLALKRETLIKAVTKINGMNVSPNVKNRFFKRCQPGFVDICYSNYKAMRDAQQLAWDKAVALSKK